MLPSSRHLLFRGLASCPKVVRPLSVSAAVRGNKVESSVDDQGIATVSMNNGPANSLNLEFMQELRSSLLEAEKSSKAVVLTSSLPTIFCAGLEITEMYQPDEKRLREFWRSLQDLWISLYTLKKPVAAAINGHSPAGGCLLAMSCDYRVMVGPKYTIGLNETKLGIVAPPWFKDVMVNVVGTRQTELALLLGTLFSAEQALNIGMLDQVVENKDEALLASKKLLGDLIKIPGPARHASKMLMRADTVERLIKNKDDDVERFVSVILRPEMQAPLGKYLEALKNKKKK